jgi:hypothetical protein
MEASLVYSLYVALGDSMTTDHYPTCDARNLDAPPARLDPLGAAALLHSGVRSKTLAFTPVSRRETRLRVRR